MNKRLAGGKQREEGVPNVSKKHVSGRKQDRSPRLWEEVFNEQQNLEVADKMVMLSKNSGEA